MKGCIQTVLSALRMVLSPGVRDAPPCMAGHRCPSTHVRSCTSRSHLRDCRPSAPPLHLHLHSLDDLQDAHKAEEEQKDAAGKLPASKRPKVKRPKLTIDNLRVGLGTAGSSGWAGAWWGRVGLVIC